MKFASVLLAIGCVVSTLSAQWLETTISLPDSSLPNDLCYNPTDNKVYAANWGTDNVTVIDGATNTIVATIPTAAEPSYFCYNSQGNKVYCTHYTSGLVSVIDAGVDTVLVVIPAGPYASSICYNPTDNKVYCPSSMNNSVYVIDCAADTVIARIACGDYACAMVHNPVQNRVYVMNLSANSISVIRDSTPAGIEEGPMPRAARLRTAATIVRGELRMEAGSSASSSPSWLLDAAGRRVIELQAGANDVSNLAPGVYFVRSEPGAVLDALSATKVVIQR